MHEFVEFVLFFLLYVRVALIKEDSCITLNISEVTLTLSRILEAIPGVSKTWKGLINYRAKVFDVLRNKKTSN